MCMLKRDGNGGPTRCATHTGADLKKTDTKLEACRGAASSAHSELRANPTHANREAYETASAQFAEANAEHYAALTEHAQTPSGWMDVYERTEDSIVGSIRKMHLKTLRRGSFLQERRAQDAGREFDETNVAGVHLFTIGKGRKLTRNDALKVGTRARQIMPGGSFTVHQGNMAITITRHDDYVTVSGNGVSKNFPVGGKAAGDMPSDEFGAQLLTSPAWVKRADIVKGAELFKSKIAVSDDVAEELALEVIANANTYRTRWHTDVDAVAARLYTGRYIHAGKDPGGMSPEELFASRGNIVRNGFLQLASNMITATTPLKPVRKA